MRLRLLALGKYTDAPTPIVRFDNDKFQVLHDVVSTFHEHGQQPCCNKILAMMLLIEGMWNHQSASETDDRRFERIAKKIFRTNQLTILDARSNASF